MRVATWNIGWASGGRRELVRDRLAGLDADVIVVTEGDAAALPDDYTVVSPDDGWGYRVAHPHRRKVLLASRRPISDLTTTTPKDMPGGRLVSATIVVGSSPVRWHAVCIPWSQAHVSTGRRDARPWSEHEAFLRGLHQILNTDAPGLPWLVIGDFNQRLPRGRQPEQIHALLLECLGNARIGTAGTLPGLTAPGVNHIVGSPTIAFADVAGFGRRSPEGSALSDHDGVIATLSCTP